MTVVATAEYKWRCQCGTGVIEGIVAQLQGKLVSPERLAFSAFCGKPEVRSNRRGVAARAGRVGVVLEDCAVLAGKACTTETDV